MSVKETKAIIIIISVAIISCSCKSEHQQMNASVAAIAKLECSAISLRNQRFSLADKIRFGQDSLMSLTKAGRDTASLNKHLSALDSEKQVLHLKSVVLADSIKATMEKVMALYIGNKEEERLFNHLLDSTLKSGSCK